MTDLGRVRKRAGVVRGTTAGRNFEPVRLSEDDFMTRIQLALDMTPTQLANALEVPVWDVLDRDGPRANTSSSVTDPFWNTLKQYVDARISGCLAIKDELDRKLRVDQREHLERINKMRGG
jgi:hypothetical protein